MEAGLRSRRDALFDLREAVAWEIHGQTIANESDRAAVRLVMLPYELHGYVARESVEHALWEMLRWFDKHVKNAAPRSAK